MTREEAIKILKDLSDCSYIGSLASEDFEALKMAIKALEQEAQTFKWCTDCREYDQEKHCCHRWSKAIRNTVEEMKQEYIEREVLDKIRAEIKERTSNRGFLSCQVSEIHGAIDAIFDKYKAEQE